MLPDSIDSKLFGLNIVYSAIVNKLAINLNTIVIDALLFIEQKRFSSAIPFTVVDVAQTPIYKTHSQKSKTKMIRSEDSDFFIQSNVFQHLAFCY